MRSVLAGMIIGGCLTVAGGANAAYVIKLKNGNEFITGRYWESGQQVYFETVDGTFGIAKAMVTQIEKTDRPWRVARKAAPADTANKTEATLKTRDKSTTDEKTAAKVNQPPAPPQPPVADDVADLKRQTGNANQMSKEEIQTLIKQVSDYRKKLLSDPKLFFEHGQEVNDLQEMTDSLTKALKQ